MPAMDGSGARRPGDSLENFRLDSTMSGVEIDPLYTAENAPTRQLELPGVYPYTRGIHPQGYRGRLWTMRQFSGFATAAETNRRYHYLLQNGQTGLSVAFDMPTLMGQDSDAPTSRGEIGHCGVAIDSLADMETLFDGIPLGEISTSMTINSPATILLTMYLAVAEEQGVPFSNVNGTLQNDILKEFIAQKEFIFPPEPSMRLVVESIEYCGAQDERSWKLRFHTQTAGVSLTAQQPELNIARTAVEALAAVLGGTQSLHTNAMDEVLALPTDRAAMIALRTQQMLGYETGVANTVDPLGGSYFVESLTRVMEAEAENYFKKIEELGGVIAAIEQGFFQREIADASFRYQQELEQRRRVMVGVNEFAVDEEPQLEILRIDPRLEVEQAGRVAEVRRKRDAARCSKALTDLRKAASGTDNLMPYILDAVRAYATEGEIMGTLTEVFGTYTEEAVI